MLALPAVVHCVQPAAIPVRCFVHAVSLFIHLAMKKVKHRLVEKMNESTADSLGLSRAVLVNGKFNSMALCYSDEISLNSSP